MRKNRVVILLGLAVLLSLGAIGVSAATKTKTFHVEGMRCNKCSTSITKALKATAGVEEVEVSLEKGTAVVRFDDGKVTEASLREVINSTGFKVVEEKTAGTETR